MAFNWQGAWNSGTAYALGDAVYYGGNAYISIQVGTNNIPASAPTFWSILALQGAVGATGSQGYTTDASLLVAGTLADSRLSGNVAQLSTANTFTGVQTVTDTDLMQSSLISNKGNLWTYMFSGQTTNATPTELLCGTARLVVASGQDVAFVMQGNCAQTSATVSATTRARFKAEGGIARVAAGNVALDAAITVAYMTGSPTLVPATNVALTADTTNQALAVKVTGLAATTIDWVILLSVTVIS